ncbi:MAG: hypothetical protein V7L22_28080 [Nostoc sp.]
MSADRLQVFVAQSDHVCVGNLAILSDSCSDEALRSLLIIV